MNQAFYTGVVGVQTHQFGLNTVSDNLANVNSVGFRASRPEFASLFEESVNQTTQSSSISSSIGIGSRAQATMMTQQTGSYLLSDRTTDLAIGGDGWFAIQKGEDTIFTRAGNFTFDANRDLVTPDGYHLLGTMGNNVTDGILTQTLGSLELGNVEEQVALNFPNAIDYPAKPTSIASFSGNMGIEHLPASMSARVVDSDGNPNTLKLLFRPTAVQPAEGISLDITATVTSYNETTVYDTLEGTALFDTTGELLSHNLTTIDNNGSPVTIDLGSGYLGVTSSINVPLSSSSNADGDINGELVGYDINDHAEVVASFSNGYSSVVGKVALFHFPNEQGLDRISGTYFRESSNSGKAMFYTDADGNNILGSKVFNNMLENSNVRLEVGLTELIIMQRAFDANAKSITTGDELIQKALQM
jgi:flagellar hook protein FlgE